VLAEAPAWLAPGGHLLVETSEQQAPAAVDAVSRAGLTASRAGSRDATVVIGTRPA
jgi:release factor glutamine methyltransferase